MSYSVVREPSGLKIVPVVLYDERPTIAEFRSYGDALLFVLAVEFILPTSDQEWRWIKVPLRKGKRHTKV